MKQKEDTLEYCKLIWAQLQKTDKIMFKGSQMMIFETPKIYIGYIASQLLKCLKTAYLVFKHSLKCCLNF